MGGHEKLLTACTESSSNQMAWHRRGDRLVFSIYMCLKAISGSWSPGELFKAWAEAGAFFGAGRNAPPGHWVTNTAERVLFSQASFFHYTLQIDINPHMLLRIGSYTVSKGTSFNSWFPLVFFNWNVCAVLFRQEKQRCCTAQKFLWDCQLGILESSHPQPINKAPWLSRVGSA